MVIGEEINEEALVEQAADAARGTIKQQFNCGIEIPNNGERYREEFFLYIQRRMTGFDKRDSKNP